MNGILWLALAAGAAAALPKKQQHNQMKLPSFRGVAEVRASLPGRIRLYMPAVSQQPELAAQMKAQLEGTGAVHQVTMQPLTGSVLILYDESQVQAPVVLGAAMKLMGLDDQVNAPASGKVQQGVQLLLRACARRLYHITPAYFASAWLGDRMPRHVMMWSLDCRWYTAGRFPPSSRLYIRICR